ncbi:unnamed protein product [Brassica oleracea var. botrytis]
MSFLFLLPFSSNENTMGFLFLCYSDSVVGFQKLKDTKWLKIHTSGIYLS